MTHRFTSMNAFRAWVEQRLMDHARALESAMLAEDARLSGGLDLRHRGVRRCRAAPDSGTGRCRRGRSACGHCWRREGSLMGWARGRRDPTYIGGPEVSPT